ncbi:amino acid adenylation domain-containing protein [Vibrio sp. Of7-15]|uniref:non-ribosomal peptide synthetase n=1 Tax=Vibrio sp. Of7-15 TaxID=2724879 RepID=UPI001EF3A0E9|nr:non-ribosomal peptide synthetase [Vibrio sp. Of7-15]MCG7495643.1 amino acid adenylation domain-containing protein [Vibrio sp. Of7-15]
MWQLIVDAWEQDVWLWAEGENIEIAFGDNEPSERLISAIRSNKSELLLYLNANQIHSEEVFEAFLLSNSAQGSAQHTSQNAIEAIYPATSLQQGFILHHVNHPDDDAYRVQLLLDYHHALDIAAYCEAWRLASLRYPALRTCFDWDGEGEILQVVTKDPSIGAANFTVVDLSELDSRAAIDAEIKKIQQQDRLVPFDLKSPGLMRFIIIKQHDECFTVIKTEHHAISDGWSSPVLLEAVHGYYATLCESESPKVETDNAYHEVQKYYQSQQKAVDTYWSEAKAHFSGTNDIRLMLSHRDDVTHLDAMREPAEIQTVIENERLTLLKSMCRKSGVTLNVVLQFAWHKLLQTYSLDEQTIVGTTVSGRDIPIEGVETSVGLYINTLPLAVNWNAEETCAEVLQQIQLKIAELNSYSNVSLAKLQKGGQRLFHSLFIYENYPVDPDAAKRGGLVLREAVEKVDYPLCLAVFDSPEAITIQLQYGKDLLSRDKVEQLLSQLVLIVEGVCKHPNQNHQQLCFATEEEKYQQTVLWNATSSSYNNDTTVLRVFEQQAALNPDNVAVVCRGERLSYKELDRRAEALAHRMTYVHGQRFGQPIQPQTFIALYIERSIDTVVGILAAWKAGAAYVPISTSFPQERVRYILADTQAPIVLTQQNKMASLHACLSLVDHDVEMVACDHGSVDPSIPTVERPAQNADSLAYVIYTSGTTGQPKGVMVQHRSVVNLLESQAKVQSYHEHDVSILLSQYIFDASVEIIFLTLGAGATLVIPTDQEMEALDELQSLISQERVTYVDGTPQLLSTLGRTESMSSVRLVVSGGEACSGELKERWKDKLVNVYGPTEATVTSFICKDFYLQPGHNCIGKPLQNTQAFILSDRMELLPTGAPGELYIGGAGVASGYLNREDLTAERFVAHPFPQIALDDYHLVYRTGDIVRWLPDGSIEYLGRNDSQVKIRGYRIELGEIEAALKQLPEIDQAVVIERRQENINYLAAFYTSANSNTCTAEALLVALKEKLPEYMVPKTLVKLPAIPLTHSGKVDVRALPDKAWNHEGYEPPKSEVERKLCAIWQEVLGVEKIGINDDFFNIGGDSILSLQVVGRANAEDIGISTRKLFSARTIKALGKMATDSQVVASQEDVSGSQLLLPIQKDYLNSGNEELSYFHQSIVTAAPEGVDSETLQSIVSALYVKHDALRMRFVKDNDWRSYYDPVSTKMLESTLMVVALCNGTREEQEKQIEEYGEVEKARFNLSTGPLFKVVYFESAEKGESKLLWIIHHLVVDGVSWRILVDDITQSWEQHKQGDIRLGAKTHSYQAWSERLKKACEEGQFENEKQYWLDVLTSRVDKLQPDCYRKETGTGETTERFEVQLDEARTDALLGKCQGIYQASINSLLLSALNLALCKWQGGHCFRVFLEGHGREELFGDVDLSQTVGWFTSIFPVLLGRGDHQYNDLSALVQSTNKVLEDIPNNGVGYNVLKHYSGDDGILCAERASDSELLFNYLGQLDQKGGVETPFQILDVASGSDISVKHRRTHALCMNGFVSKGKLTFVIDFDATVFKKIRVDAFGQAFLNGLQAIVEHGESVSLPYELETLPRALVNLNFSSKNVLKGFEPAIHINQEGSLTPIFFIPPGGAGTESYFNLADCLDTEQPVVLLENIEVHKQRQYALASLSDYYANLIVQEASNDRIKLAGASRGAVLAHDIAEKLAQQGKTIEYIYFIDPVGYTMAGDKIDALQSMPQISEMTPSQQEIMATFLDFYRFTERLSSLPYLGRGAVFQCGMDMPVEGDWKVVGELIDSMYQFYGTLEALPSLSHGLTNVFPNCDGVHLTGHHGQLLERENTIAISEVINQTPL